MVKPEKKKVFTFDRPGFYRIRVQGFFDENWTERLGGLRITAISSGAQGPVTTLYGRVVDQAQLAGVLNTLYELQLTLLSVKYMNDK